MSRELDRQTTQLVDEFVSGRMTRRVFLSRLMALGLSATAAGAILAACSSASTTSAPATVGPATAGPATAAPATGAPATAAPASQAGSDVAGNIRFLIGPWTDKEVEHHEKIAADFNKDWPNVKFTFKLFDWTTASTEVTTSLAEGSHDVYYFGEGGYVNRAAATDGFEDLTARINDPAFAAEKAKYLYWDRLEAYGGKLIGLPVCWHVEDALFVNMDKVKDAGYDETFVNSWDTFAAAAKKMTKGTDTYGLGIGIQLGGFAEWYQRLRAAGGSYLTPDLKSPNVNLPAVIDETKKMAAFFTDGVAPPMGTYTYDTAPDAGIAGKLAMYSSDLTIAAVVTGKPTPPAFEWAVLPYPPGAATRVNFNDIGLYAMSSKTPDKDLAWEVLKFWTNANEGAYWTDVSGTYPARMDAVASGYGASDGSKHLAAHFDDFAKYSVGPEPFAAWGTIEDKAEAQIQDVYSGKTSVEDAIKNIEQIVKDEAQV